MEIKLPEEVSEAQKKEIRDNLYNDFSNKLNNKVTKITIRYDA